MADERRLLEGLVELLAETVAPRVAAELAGGERAEPVDGELWRLLGVEEAAGRLGRSSRWVRERAKRGELPFVRLDGGALAFELEDLRAFAEARRVAVEAPGVLAGRLQVLGQAAAGDGSRRSDGVGNRRVDGSRG